MHLSICIMYLVYCVEWKWNGVTVLTQIPRNEFEISYADPTKSKADTI